MRSVFAWVVPESVFRSGNQVAIARWHICAGTLLIALTILPFAFVVEIIEFGLFAPMSVINLLLYSALLFSLFQMKRTESIASAVGIIMVATISATTGTAALIRGITDPAIAWLVLTPVLSALLGNSKTSLLSMTVSILALVSLAFFQSLGLLPASVNSGTDISVNHVVQLTLPIVFAGVVGTVQSTVLGIAEKETEAKQKELDLERQQVIHSQRLKSLGEMGAGIAHEINNPLAVIYGTAQNTLKRAVKGQLSDEILQRNIKRILDTTDRISSIIQSMKRISGFKHFDQSDENDGATLITEEIKAAVTIQRFNLKHIDLRLELPNDESLKIVAQDGEIAQVIGGMISNSKEAIQDQEDPWIHITVTNTDSKILIVVKDSGHGISEDVQEKMFAPFFTTRQSQGGTGLGMSVGKAIVESNGGKIHYLKSEKHTSFEIELKKAG